MLKYLILLLSFSAFANYEPNSYRRINLFTDRNRNEVLVIQSNNSVDLYSIVEIISNNRVLPTTLLTPEDFENIKREFDFGVQK